jgi:hypothetical protein
VTTSYNRREKDARKRTASARYCMWLLIVLLKTNTLAIQAATLAGLSFGVCK